MNSGFFTVEKEQYKLIRIVWDAEYVSRLWGTHTKWQTVVSEYDRWILGPLNQWELQ